MSNRPPLSVGSRPIDELRWRLAAETDDPGVAYSYRALCDLPEERVVSLADYCDLL